MKRTLSLTANQHAQLKSHLFPGDGKEAVAFALCGRREGAEKHRLLIREILLIPHECCSIRTPDQVTWPTYLLPPLLDKAANKRRSVLKIHSHPNGSPEFSSIDNDCDISFFSSVHSWTENETFHASVVMLPDGRMFGRTIERENQFGSISTINVVGDDLVFWHYEEEAGDIPEFAQSHGQAFGSATFDKLRKLRIAVVGCSGTGSPVIEQLARLGVGELVLVDPDHVEMRNLNRILNATSEDAKSELKKVDVMERAIVAMGLGTKIHKFPQKITVPEVVRSVAECDIIFGCMDGLVGRHMLNRLSTFYTIPYFDVGVKLTADGRGGIDEICGTVHYFQPGLSSFLTKRVFTSEQLRAESIKESDPSHYEEQCQSKYIKGVMENRLAVISVNMLFAALAVSEFLARLHPYRLESNARFSSHTISLSHSIYDHRDDGVPCATLCQHVGKGDVIPLLEMPILS